MTDSTLFGNAFSACVTAGFTVRHSLEDVCGHDVERAKAAITTVRDR